MAAIVFLTLARLMHLWLALGQEPWFVALWDSPALGPLSLGAALAIADGALIAYVLVDAFVLFIVRKQRGLAPFAALLSAVVLLGGLEFAFWLTGRYGRQVGKDLSPNTLTVRQGGPRRRLWEQGRHDPNYVVVRIQPEAGGYGNYEVSGLPFVVRSRVELLDRLRDRVALAPSALLHVVPDGQVRWADVVTACRSGAAAGFRDIVLGSDPVAELVVYRFGKSASLWAERHDSDLLVMVYVTSAANEEELTAGRDIMEPRAFRQIEPSPAADTPKPNAAGACRVVYGGRFVRIDKAAIGEYLAWLRSLAHRADGGGLDLRLTVDEDVWYREVEPIVAAAARAGPGPAGGPRPGRRSGGGN